MKPTLVIATDNFLPRHDGIARFLSVILPRLIKRFSVIVLAPDFGHHDHKEYHLVQIPLRKGSFGDIRLSKIKYGVIKKEIRKADVVFTQTIGPIGASALLAAKSLGKPVLSYIHSMESELVPMAIMASPLRSIMYPVMRWYTKMLYNIPELLLTPSELVDDQLSWDGVVTPKRVIKLGIDTQRFSPGSAKTLRKKLGVEEDFVVGYVGRLAREKDIRTLVRGFIRLQHRCKGVKLLVVADGLSSLKKMLRRKGIIYVGGQDSVVPYLRAMDVFVLPSLTETTCLSALEAMSCGLPIVSTPVGFVRDYVEDGKNGFFFHFRDTYALAKRLEWLMKHPTLRQRMGRAARELVEKEFHVTKMIDQVEKALVQVEKRDRYPT